MSPAEFIGRAVLSSSQGYAQVVKYRPGTGWSVLGGLSNSVGGIGIAQSGEIIDGGMPPTKHTDAEIFDQPGAAWQGTRFGVREVSVPISVRADNGMILRERLRELARDTAAMQAALAQACEAFGPIDVLVSGAAGNFLASALDM